MKILNLIVTINSPTFHSMNWFIFTVQCIPFKVINVHFDKCNLFAISIHYLLYLQLMTSWHCLLGLQLLSKYHVRVEVQVFISA